MGSSETYGRFVTQPFAELLEISLGKTCINLGSVNAGLDSFANDDDLLQIAAKADMAVLQLTGAQDLSNRYYRVHPRRNDRFLEPTPLLKGIYPEVDFTEFSFNRHMLTALERLSPERFETLRDELQSLWLTRMNLLVNRLAGQVILLWLRYTDHRPGDPGAGPYMINRPMVESLASQVGGIVEVPVQAAALSDELDTMDYGALQAPVAAHSIGPRSHERIARRLAEVLHPG